MQTKSSLKGNRLYKLLMVRLIAVVTLTMLISSGVLIWYMNRSLEQGLNEQMERLVSFSEGVLSTALWQYNNSYVDDFVDFILLAEDVVLVRVESENGIIGEKSRNGAAQLGSLASIDEAQYLVQEREIFHKSNQVGKVAIVISKKRENRQFVVSMVIAISLLLLIISVISSTIFFSIRKHFFIPLHQLEDAAQQVAKGDLDTPIVVQSDDEIGQLAKTLRYMMSTLKAITTSRDDLNAEIEARISVEQALLERERQLASLMGNLPGMVYRCKNTPDWTMLFVSDGCKQLTGYESDYLLGNKKISFGDLIHPDDRDQVWNCVQNGIEQKKTFKMTYRISTAQNQEKWVFEQGMGVYSESGELIMLEGFLQDITEQKRAEERLQLTTFSVENSSEDAFWLQPDGRFISVNTTACKSLGYTEEELLSMGVYDISTNITRELWQQRWNMLKNQRRSLFETYHKTKDGVIFPVEISTSYLNYNGREYICAFARDLTERRKSEEVLKASESRFRALFEQVAVGVALLEPLTGKVVRVNQKCADILKYSREEMETLGYQDLSVAEDYAHDTARMQQLVSGELHEYSTEKRLLTKDGEAVWVHLTISPMWVTGDAPDYHIVVVEDITTRRKADDTLRRQQRAITLSSRVANVFLRSSKEEMYDGVLTIILAELSSQFGFFGFVDDSGNLVCPSMTRDVWGNHLMEDDNVVFPRESWAGIWGDSLINCKTYIENGSLKLPEGHVVLDNAMAVPIIHRDNLIGQIVVANKSDGYSAEDQELLEKCAAQTAPVLAAHREEMRQKRERDKLEEQYLQAQKLESIGRLAGGVAHDLNNMLSPILGFGEMLMEETEKTDGRYEMMEEIVKAGKRARDMVRQLLAFSRRQTLEFKIIDLNDLLINFEKLLARTITENVIINLDLAPDLPRVVGDIGQLEQVVMNLAVNAQHAMAATGGTMTISSSSQQIDEDQIIDQEDFKPGLYVILRIHDTGEGISSDVAEHIFEPFFTTKAMDEGSGLGLATAYGIIKQHGGGIHVESEQGKGTMFTIYLPAGNEPVETDGERSGMTVGAEGHETILVVEDNPMVSNLVMSILRRKGYQPLFAENGKEALDLLENYEGNVDMLLTDIVMPQMDGKELSELVKMKYPDIKILYMSGYTNQVILRHGVMAEDFNFIQKPFLINDLTHKIRNVLDGQYE